METVNNGISTVSNKAGRCSWMVNWWEYGRKSP